MDRTAFISAAIALAAASACYTGASVDLNARPNGTDPSQSTDGTSSAVAGDLPCDLAQFLADNCTTCHGQPPSGGAPNRLMTWDDLAAPSKGDPSVDEATLALQRMQDTTRPMPPSGNLPAATIAIFQSWMSGGRPKGTCGGVTSSDPVCTSNHIARGEESYTMAPGEACIACHAQGEGPRFVIAGTVYPTAHEPADCWGASSTANGPIDVVITDATGKSFTLPANSAGNFTLSARSASIALPYTAKVVSGGKTRAMNTPQKDGDCNGCHTDTGANSAPGRVMAP